jgi:hypothetical protein
MRARRITGFLTLTLIAVTTAGVAIAAGTGTVTPPPRIAFVARSDLYPDALAAGPIAGRLGAPLFITAPTTLVPSVEQGLKDYAPELVIIAGDTTAISAGVELAIEAALNLAPDKVIRAAGATRHETAVALVELIGQYNPAFLPVDATAADADLLDGLDSSAFVRKTERRYVSLLAETMTPVVSGTSYDSTQAYLTTTAGAADYIGHLALPDGTRIVSVRAEGRDTDPNHEYQYQLFRYRLADSPVWTPVTDSAVSGVAFSGGLVTTPAQISSGAAVVDNSQYAYGIFLELPAPTAGTLGVLRFVVEVQ